MSKQRIRSILILVGILLICGGIRLYYNHKGPGGLVDITVNGQTYQTVPLDVDTTIQIETNTGYNIIQIKDGQVTVTEADCANQICVESRSISQNGEVIACIPHGLVITVVMSHKEVDAVAY